MWNYYLACIQSCDWKTNCQNKKRQGLNKAKSSIDSQVEVPILLFGGVAKSTVGPEVEPVVCANRGALVDQLHADAKKRTKKSNILEILYNYSFFCKKL